MKIACPSCDTKYALNSDALGTHGRKMKCAKCAHVWTARPVDTDLDVESVRQAAAAALVSRPDVIDDNDISRWEQDLKEERAAEEARAATDSKFSEAIKSKALSQPAGSRKKANSGRNNRLQSVAARLLGPLAAFRQKFGQFILWVRSLTLANQIAVLIAFLMPVLLISGLFLGRQFMVRQFPDMASLYAIFGVDVNLYGLQFEELRTVRRPEDGVAVLIVEGTVRNISENTRDIPRLHFILSGRNREVYAWQDDASLIPLNAGETVRFRTVLASPPDVADELHVRFLSNDPRLNRL